MIQVSTNSMGIFLLKTPLQKHVGGRLIRKEDDVRKGDQVWVLY